jgi:small neutral amino acid transporter SnatA (MarC family)
VIAVILLGAALSVWMTCLLGTPIAGGILFVLIAAIAASGWQSAPETSEENEHE